MAAGPSPEQPLHGSCLCGGVQFEVTAPFLWANHCHCSRCRKHSGPFGGTQGRVSREGIRPEFHLFVGSRAPWDELPDDGLPRYDDAYED